MLNQHAAFSHDGRNFEIRTETMNNEIKVRLFENEKLASPIAYCVAIETAFDAKTSGFPLDIAEELVQLLEHDVTSGRLRLYPTN